VSALEPRIFANSIRISGQHGSFSAKTAVAIYAFCTYFGGEISTFIDFKVSIIATFYNCTFYFIAFMKYI